MWMNNYNQQKLINLQIYLQMLPSPVDKQYNATQNCI